MRHSRINKSTRHKKLKTINGPNEVNFVDDKLLSKNNKEQAVPEKLAQIMEFKAKNKQINKPVGEATKPKKSAKLKQKYNTLCVKTGVQTTIEKGMTRIPKAMPETVEKGILESEYQFMNRLNRMVAKSIAEATLEDHFNVDLGGKVRDESANGKCNDFISIEESEKIEKRKNKRKLKDQKRKERKQKKQYKLVKQKESQEFSFQKESIPFGDLVHQPPSLNFGKKSKLKIGK